MAAAMPFPMPSPFAPAPATIATFSFKPKSNESFMFTSPLCFDFYGGQLFSQVVEALQVLESE